MQKVITPFLKLIVSFMGRKNYLLLVLASLIAVPFPCYSQTEKCGYDYIQEQWFSTNPKDFTQNREQHISRVTRFRQANPNPNYLSSPIPPSGAGDFLQGDGCPNATYIIPVVVHVIKHPGVPATNLDTALIEQQIEILNRAFRNASGNAYPSVNTGIQFCLAKVKPNNTSFYGINYISSTKSNHTVENIADLASLSYFPASRYLNIYVVKRIVAPGTLDSSIVGYSTPMANNLAYEGVVVDYNWFGNYNVSGSPFNADSRGYTLVHEVGHYLGLYHPFQGGCNEGINDATCATLGDLCCDVPQTSNGNNTTCSFSLNTCQNENYSGIDPKDMKQNYMDYTDEYCQTTFTSDQTDIMLTTLSTIRKSLCTPKNINSLKLSCCVLSPRFEGANFICKNDSALYTSIRYDSAEYVWSLFKNDTLRWQRSDTSNIIHIVPPATGTYTVSLHIVINGISYLIEYKKYLEVANCGATVKSERGNWYFGDHGGLRFTSNGAIKDMGPYNNPPNIKTFGGSISQSSATGRLLFYGGGEGYPHIGDSFKIFNKNYAEMKYKNGIRPHGSHNGGQCIALPFKNDSMRFHLFTMVENDAFSNSGGGYYHSTVRVDKDSVYADTSDYLKDSLGVKILPNLVGSYVAIPRCDEKSFWLLCIQKKPSSTDSTFIQKFFVDSFNTIHYYGKQTIIMVSPEASIGVSPDGNFLAFNYGVYSFDKQTADLKIIYRFNREQYIDEGALGIAFSSSGKLVYYSTVKTDVINNRFQSELFQINPFSASDNGEKFIIEQSSRINAFGHIKSGPDSVIYVASTYNDFVSKIETPNDQFGASGSNAEYTKEGVKLSANGQGGVAGLGLPNYLEVKKRSDIEVDFNYKFVSCNSIKLYPTECCANSYFWDFGNGDTSWLKYPYYIYGDTGTYTVTLIANGDTVIKTFKIGNSVPPPALHGDSTICDFNKYHEYSTPFNQNYRYVWLVYNNSLNVYEGNKIYIKWLTSGYRRIVLIAENTKTGCLNATSVGINNGNIPTNNIIPTNFVICDSTNTDLIIGTTPTNVTTGTYSFQWHYMRADSTWKQIDSATFKNFNPCKVPYTTQLIREVNQNGCKNFSNRLNLVILTQTNKIQLSQSPCTIDSGYIVSGDTAYGDPIVSYINWQYSTDGVDWNYFSIHTQNLVSTLGNDSIYVRRLIDYTGFCEIASNVIKVVPDVFITKQPVPQYVCSFQDFTFSVEVNNRKNLPLTYWWRHFDSTSNSWTLHTCKGNSFTDHAVYHSTDYIQFVIQTPCGYINSDVVLLKVKHTGPTISTHPSGQYVDEGDKTNLIAEVFNPYEAGLKYGWQYRKDLTSYNHSDPHGWPYKSPQWVYVTDSVKNKLRLIVGICDDSTEYRFVATNGCTSYSNPARLYFTPKADLWMKDSERDTGAEPNRFVARKTDPSGRTWDLFKSPDLYNCQNGFNCTDFENAEYKISGDNYVRFKIRNRGTQTSKPARLYLYWTIASTSETWDRDWRDSSHLKYKDAGSAWLSRPYLFDNINSSSPFYGQRFPYGGAINKTGILIHPLDTGEVLDSFYAWRPPNPAWYHTTVNNKIIASTKLQICLLARIEYCDEYPHAMAFNELYRVAVDTNIINNNNIVTHNLWVSDAIPGGPWSGRPRRIIWTRVNQPRDSTHTPITLSFDDRAEVYDPNVRVIAHFDDSLWNTWIRGGSVGSGFIPLDSQRVEITDEHAEFGNISSDSLLIGNIGFEFLPLDTAVLPTDTSYYTLSQTSDEDGAYDGGVIFRVDFNTVVYEEGGGEGSEPHVATINTKKSKNDYYLVYPNPSSTTLTIQITAEKNSKHKIQITDLTGKILISETCDLKQMENCTKKIDISHLAVGTYFVKLSNDIHSEIRKINILR